MDTRAILLDYIKRVLVRGRKPDLKVDDDLLSTGLLDSLGILQLVTFVEERFGIKMLDEDVVFEHFESVEALAAYLDQHAE